KSTIEFQQFPASLLLALLLPQLLAPVASGSESEPDAASPPCPQTADQPPPPCDRLPFACLSCRVNATAGCRLGAAVPAVPCEPLPDVNCTGDRGPLPRTVVCRYCHQLPPELCIGRRSFRRMLRCDWSGGYKWSVSMWCTALLGGFGLDRFYLGQWREGLGKLFSFGGFGVWSLVDAILIAVGYISPIDESVYAP
uniref:TM2 domain-containing protein n=1 Tax=Macrostomum lignano TaxID=282301 RepID=A0A1I8IMG3_9PLAT